MHLSVYFSNRKVPKEGAKTAKGKLDRAFSMNV